MEATAARGAKNRCTLSRGGFFFLFLYGSLRDVRMMFTSWIAAFRAAELLFLE